ncbi:hypothetical protein JRI60_22865 [Archangium violaceum]|uniref:hypothetical protein n=1 Tax=Archangium violaceum TaxID=83451 RepID=UPI00194F813B|nr:hypothetical protein [Archangium violaceum]QRO01661.1 hypothetical protein JRI60_22865 [Archangium violaceum]
MAWLAHLLGVLPLELSYAPWPHRRGVVLLPALPEQLRAGPFIQEPHVPILPSSGG